VDGEKIILKKYEPACLFCGNANNIKYFCNRIVCQECINQLATD